MKTAIVYRANPHLDANLLPLKEKVDFFVRLDPADFSSDEDARDEKVRQVLMTALGGEESSVVFFTDLTCARGVSRVACRDAKRINLISQEAGPLESHIGQIADEGKPVILVRENLADHVRIDEVDPYSLDDQDRKPGGWYHAKVLAIWERMLRARAVPYSVVSIRELDRNAIGNSVVVCDHHCANNHYALLKGMESRNAFLSLPSGKFVTPEDILSHCL